MINVHIRKVREHEIDTQLGGIKWTSQLKVITGKGCAGGAVVKVHVYQGKGHEVNAHRCTSSVHPTTSIDSS